jgi:hypothetical protein
MLPFSGSETKASKYRAVVIAGYLNGLLFDPEDGVNMFLRKASVNFVLLHDCTYDKVVFLRYLKNLESIRSVVFSLLIPG